MTGSVIECIAWLSQQKEGTFEVNPFHEKRSLNANAMYFKMCGQMAKAINISTAHMHNLLLRKYGEVEIVDGQEVFFALPDTPEAEKQVEEDAVNHFLPTQQKIGSRRWYKLLKPSHEFDTVQMARLIDGAAEEMRQMGLTPPMDEQIQKAIELYDEKHNSNRRS